MSGPSFWEFLLLCLIGLIVLGPKRLPQVANQVGTWVGQARRMTRTLKRQLEEELELDKPVIKPPRYTPPHDDDTYSPLHEQPSTAVAGMDVSQAVSTEPSADEEGEEAASNDSESTDEDRDERSNA